MPERPSFQRTAAFASHALLVVAFLGLGVALVLRGEQDRTIETTVPALSDTFVVPAEAWEAWSANPDTETPFKSQLIVYTDWKGPAHEAAVRACFPRFQSAKSAREGLNGYALAHVVEHPSRAKRVVQRTALSGDTLEGLVTADQGYCIQLPTVSVDAGTEDTPSVVTTYLVRSLTAQPAASLGAVHIHTTHAPRLNIFEKLIPLLVLIAMLLKLLAWNISPRAPSPRVEWRAFDPILAVVALVIGTTIVISVVQPTPTDGLSVMIGMLFSALVYVGLCWLLAAARSDSPPDALGVVAPKQVGIRTPLVLGVLMAVAAAVFLSLIGPAEQSSQMQELVRTPGTVLAVTATALLAPWYEELFFRGLIYGAIERRVGAIWALVASALLFTLLHVQQHLGFIWPIIPILALSGLASFLRYRSQSTTSAFALHLGYNGLLIFTTLLQ